MDAYPEAKVVLVNRDVDSWANSFLSVAVTKGAFTFASNVIIAMEPFLPKSTYTATMVQKQLLGYFKASDAKGIEQNARLIIRQHYQDIRDACASTPGRLLGMKIEEGRTPLCRFLYLPVPSVPVPSTNEIAIQQAKISEHRGEKLREGALALLTYLAIPLMAGAVGWWYFTSKS
ncbi:hypothetical protein CLAFUW4_09775 [Fulvia fulva]|uniref:Uncharacterized protein n=1 Tax=Passalora fulva TaxID=5499 RepID=A0A9Q8PI25_PASFU|nr:uncharacterized protein CLAFUR5_12462 [Fulvia fulva]KAK4615914.1 hypothetical protein CLAFUR4_09780 [Fulvia fulva]KAK4616428.1 hypothetical protein CLAFUR0_09773 [Fulvia fulva]UJO22911.1 hypothetical protein CLAFUR5_12462 [Fulvia fulva]WPV19116.1 hypothetical protein CLAFUW4_09775 [Fulvia fulva]WPV34165.1 hypothetical protein CLAFUW7_09778 [Fulvia fulva]